MSFIASRPNGGRDNKACALCLGEGREHLNSSFPESQAAAFQDEQRPSVLN